MFNMKKGRMNIEGDFIVVSYYDNKYERFDSDVNCGLGSRQ